MELQKLEAERREVKNSIQKTRFEPRNREPRQHDWQPKREKWKNDSKRSEN